MYIDARLEISPDLQSADSAGAGFSADSGLAVYDDVAKAAADRVITSAWVRPCTGEGIRRAGIGLHGSLRSEAGPPRASTLLGLLGPVLQRLQASPTDAMSQLKPQAITSQSAEEL